MLTIYLSHKPTQAACASRRCKPRAHGCVAKEARCPRIRRERLRCQGQRGNRPQQWFRVWQVRFIAASSVTCQRRRATRSQTTEEGNTGYILTIIQVALGAVLLLAAIGKLLNAEHFQDVLRLSRLPEASVVPGAVLAPVVEFGLAVGLVLSTPPGLTFALSATAGLLAVFTAWMLFVYAKGLRIQCGCFGAGGSEVGPRTIARNAMFMALAVAGLVLSYHTQTVFPGPSIWMIATFLGCAASTLLVMAYRQARPALVLSERDLEQATGSAGHGVAEARELVS